MRSVVLVFVLATILSQGGCYYGHLASGQIKILWQRQPISEALADPDLPLETRNLLAVVEAVRVFASELGLRVDDQYTSYVDWPGDRIVTTLVRTRAGSLEIEPWWFPIVGHLPYKGYFDPSRAASEAERLLEKGRYEVCVSGVTAYSTLGWFADPVTQPMLRRGAGSLVETLLHELVHATAFLDEDVDFNEGVAQFIGQQAAIRFFERAESEPLAQSAAVLPSSVRVRDSIADRSLIAERTIVFKDRVMTLDGLPDRAEIRAIAERETREELRQLPLRVLDPHKVARAARLSDACLALRGAYVRDLPRHARVLAALNGDLSAMIARLRVWAEESKPSADFFIEGFQSDQEVGSLPGQPLSP